MDNLCKNCGIEVTSHYCPNCGQRTKTKRIDGSIIFQEFLFNNFTFHTGLPFTIKTLVLHPKRVIEDYLAGKRIRYTGAVHFFLFILIFLGVISLITVEIGLVKHGKVLIHMANSKVDVSNWIKNLRILFIVVSSFGTYIVYKSKKYNLAEHFIINFYLLGITLFILEVMMLMALYKLERYRSWIFFLMVFVYYIRIFYDERIRIKDILKGLWCFILSIFCYGLIVKAIVLISKSGWFN